MTATGLLLIGGGGHCHSVIDVLEAAQMPIAGIVHGPDCALQPVLGYPSLGRDQDLETLWKTFRSALVTVGQVKSPALRRYLFGLLKQRKFILPRVVSPLAHVSPHAVLGEGTIIMHYALVNAGVSVGANCIINTKALVEHDCVIADNCHIAIGAILGGGVSVGEGSFIGAGAVVQPTVRIGVGCVIGMGTRVLKNVADGMCIWDAKGEIITSRNGGCNAMCPDYS